MTEPRRYRAYILRLWLAEGDDGRPVWRAALEDARSGERHGFAILAQLCVFLEEQTAGWTGGTWPPQVPEAGDRPMEN
jgi:hypothetical protein